jgi:hypothetical protein
LRRAVEVSRELSAGNPDNVELKVAVASALIERGDAWMVLARQPNAPATDRDAAMRDYSEAVTILDALKSAGAIEGTDLETLDDARSKRDGLTPSSSSR